MNYNVKINLRINKMEDKITLELDEDFVKKIFELNDTFPPENEEITLQMLKKQLNEVSIRFANMQDEFEELKKKVELLSKHSASVSLNNASSPSASSSKSNEKVPKVYSQPITQFIDASSIPKKSDEKIYDDNGNLIKGKMLVIDDLGVITYQLSTLYKRLGFSVTSAKEVYDAISIFKHSSYQYVIMDLFIPTEREGYILLDELQKIAKSRNESPVIGIMSASSKKEHKQECEKRGAAFYLEKVEDWQKSLKDLVSLYLG